MSNVSTDLFRLYVFVFLIQTMCCSLVNLPFLFSLTRTLLAPVSLSCLRIRFVVKGAGAVLLLLRLEYKTSVISHNVDTQNVKIARRDRPHILASH